MSNQVDNRVVSMQFDNKNFEKNVAHTMSTLDKFKAKLNLSGASKGLEEVDTAAKKVNMNSLANGVETVRAKFSALEVMGVTALANITNSAVNAGKRIISALAIDPIKTGLSEYETKINAIQVIRSNTRGKNTMEEITDALAELNDYADRTIYNYAQMTDNVGKFVAQGLDVKAATNAIMGMANLAGASGASAQDMSRATYQMSQALGGVIRKMDWNSLRNANMATVELKNVLTDLAKVEGIDIDGMIAEKGTFEETLEKGWLTGDLFTKAMNIYSDVYSEAELRAMGFKDDQIKNFKELAAMAKEATTEVKTMSQLWDVLKETAQSGWSQTWELIIGDFDTAKKMFTAIQNYLSDILNRASDFRNKIVEMVMGNPLSVLINKISGMVNDAKGLIKPLEDYTDIVNRIIRGEFGNQGDNGDRNYRKKLVEAAGYDYAHAQNLVNEKLGCSVRLTSAYTESLKSQNKEQSKTIEQLAAMSDAELKAMGYTEDQISALRQLTEYAKASGMSLGDFIKSVEEGLTGRELIINSFKNAVKGLETVFASIKEAWTDAFPISAEDIAMKIYGVLVKIHDFSKRWDISKDTDKINNITRTFKGLFALLDIVATIIGGPIKIAFKILGQLLSALDMDIWGLTAIIGDAIVGFRDWLESSLDFTKVFEKIAPYVKNATDAIKSWIEGLKNSDNIPRDIITGLVNGLMAGIKWVGDIAVKLGSVILEKIKGVLGIHSPSTEMMEIGRNIIAGLLEGIKKAAPVVWDAMKGLGNSILNVIKNINLGEVLAAISGIMIGKAILGTSKSINNFVNTLSNAVDIAVNIGNKIASVFTGLNQMFTDFGKAQKRQASAELIKSIAIAIGVLAASVWLLSKIEPGALWGAIGAIGALAGVITVLFILIDKLGTAGKEGEIKKTFSIGKMVIAMVGISISLVILASVMKKLSGISWEGLAKGFVGIIGLAGLMVGLVYILKYVKDDIDKVGGTFLKMAGAMAIMAVLAKLIATIDLNALLQGGLAILALGGVFVTLIWLTKLVNKDIDKVGGVFIKMAAAMLLMAIIVKLVSALKPGDIFKGVLVITLLGGIITGLIAATRLAGSNDLKRVGLTLLAATFAIGILAAIMVMLSFIKPEKLAIGLIAVTILSGIIAGLIYATRLAGGNDLKRVGFTILSLAVSIGILGLVTALLSLIDPKKLVKGIIAVTLLSSIIVGLIAATKIASGDKLLSVAFTILAASAAIGFIGILAGILGFIPAKNLVKGIAIVGLLSSLVVGLMVATQLAKDVRIGTILAISGAVAILALVVSGLSFIDPKRLAGATIAISILMGMFSVMTLAAKNVQGSWTTLLVIISVVVVLGGILYLIAQLPVENSIGAAVALSVLMLSMSGCIAILKTIGGSVSDAMMGVLALLAMAVPLIAFVGVLAAMQNVKNVMPNVNALVVLSTAMTLLLIPLTIVGAAGMAGLPYLGALALLAMAVPLIAFVGVLAAMQNVKNVMPNVMALVVLSTAMTLLLLPLTLVGAAGMAGLPYLGALALLAMAVPLIAFVGVLAAMQNVKNVMPNVNALVVLSTAMTLLLIPLTIVGAAGMAGLPYLGALALLAMAVPLIAFVGVLAAMQNVKNAEKNAHVLIKLVTALMPCLVAVALIAPLAMMAPAAILALTEAMIIFGVFVTAVGALTTLLPQIEGFIDAGIPILEKLANGIGSILGNFISGFAVSAMSGLPVIGLLLSQFMMNATPFIVGAKMIDESVVDGVKAIAEAILIITAVDIIQGLTSWLTGGSSIARFGEEIAAFGPSIKKFADSVAGIDSASVQAAANAAKALAEMAATIPNEGGVASWFAGENSISKFASELPGLGENLKAFSDSTAGINAENITAAAEAAKALAEMTATIPNEGGVASWFAGENSIANFGEHLTGLGEGLKGFADNVAGINAESVSAAVDAAKAVVEMSSEIPNEGGVASWFAGDNSIANFGEHLTGLGEGLKGFADNVAGINAESVSAAVDAAKAVVEMSSEIPNEGGVASWFAGDNSIANFGEQLGDLGSAISTFADNVGNTNIDSINKAVTATKALTELLSVDISDKASTMKDFGDKLEKFGKKIAKFCEKMSDIKDTAVSSAIDKFNKLVNMPSTLSVDNISSLEKFSDTLVSVAKNGIEEFVSTLNSSSVKTDSNTAISDLVSSTADNIKTKTNEDKFKSAGKYLVEGLAKGIRNNKSKATKAAQEVADSVEQIIRSAWEVNSPSKLFYRIALGIGEGITYALGDSTRTVNTSARDLADTATNGFGNAIQKIVEFINTDMDTQPTIRPVLDLSDVKSGANTINGMFSGNRTLTISAPGVGAIAASMSTRQNGNADLVSAINKLAKSNSKSGDTYQINGINYNEGSDVADAIQTLVRAANIERRT